MELGGPNIGTPESTFIGRQKDQLEAKQKLRKYRSLLLYGHPIVGKAALASQVAEELVSEYEKQNQSCDIYYVHCDMVNSWSALKRTLCHEFSLDDSSTDQQLARAIQLYKQNVDTQILILLLLRLHHYPQAGKDVDNMAELLRWLARHDVIVVVTSHRPLELRVIQEVRPLSLDDCLDLLLHRAPVLDAAEFKELVQDHCHGRPPLVMQLAHLAKGTYSSEDLTKALKANPNLLLDRLNRDDECSKLFSKLTPDFQRHLIQISSLLGGTFTEETMRLVVSGKETEPDETRHKALKQKMQEENILAPDDGRRHLRLEPMLFYPARKLGHLATDDLARQRVVTFLGRVLTKTECDLYVEGQEALYGDLLGDLPHLLHVLRQAVHCTENTYTAFLKVAETAENLLPKLFPHETLEFCQNMIEVAVSFGKPRDLVAIRALMGASYLANGTRSSWEEALKCYTLAIADFHREKMESEKNSISYFRLLVELGLVYFNLNKLAESKRCLDEAVKISQKLQEPSKEKLNFYLLTARSYLALPILFSGHIQEAYDLIMESLRLCEDLSPNHPEKASLINCLGLVFERIERGAFVKLESDNSKPNRALQYYNAALVELRRYEKVIACEQLPTLNNIAMQHNQKGETDQALLFLEKALKLGEKWHYYTALTYLHIGQVYLKSGDYPKAEENLQESAKIYARVTPEHDIRGKLALTMAHAYIVRNKSDLVRKSLQEVCNLSETIQLSDDGLAVLASSIQHRVQFEGWTSPDLTPSLTRIDKLLASFSTNPSERLRKHQTLIQDIIALRGLQDISSVDTDALSTRIAQQCQMCGYISSQAQLAWKQGQSRVQRETLASKTLHGSPALDKAVLALTKTPTACTAMSNGQSHDGVPNIVSQHWNHGEQSAGPGLCPRAPVCTQDMVPAESMHVRHCCVLNATVPEVDRQLPEAGDGFILPEAAPVVGGLLSIDLLKEWTFAPSPAQQLVENQTENIQSFWTTPFAMSPALPCSLPQASTFVMPHPEASPLVMPAENASKLPCALNQGRFNQRSTDLDIRQAHVHSHRDTQTRSVRLTVQSQRRVSTSSVIDVHNGNMSNAFTTDHTRELHNASSDTGNGDVSSGENLPAAGQEATLFCYDVDLQGTLRDGLTERFDERLMYGDGELPLRQQSLEHNLMSSNFFFANAKAAAFHDSTDSDTFADLESLETQLTTGSSSSGPDVCHGAMAANTARFNRTHEMQPPFVLSAPSAGFTEQRDNFTENLGLNDDFLIPSSRPGSSESSSSGC